MTPVYIVILGLLLMLVGGVTVLAVAFRESIIWGICALFVPFAKLIFCIGHWEAVQKGVGIHILGVVVLVFGLHNWGVNVGELVNGGLHRDGAAIAHAWQGSGAGQGKSAEGSDNPISAQKKEKQAEISATKLEIAGLEAKVSREFLQLTDARKSLKPSDQVAVRAFNFEAAAYGKDNQDLAGKKTQLNTLWKELGIITTEADRQAMYENTKVVLYTTQWCPACRSAKAYLSQNGIAYREKDVESSQQAAEEFHRFGGNGVPLVVVNGHQMSGFSPEWVQQMLAEK